MAQSSPQSRGHENTLSFLNGAIETLNLAKGTSSITPVRAVFGSASLLLAMIKDSLIKEQDYIELGLSCADVCQALDRGLEGRQTNELSKSMLGAIEKLTTTVTAIQKKIIKQGKRNKLSRVFYSKSDKDAVTSWGRDLDRILHIFNTELSMNNRMILLDLYRSALAGQDVTGGQRQSLSESTITGELPPPPPRVCFGRDEVVEKIVGLAHSLSPIALIGAGGIGKTSIALTVLHDDRIKSRFGRERRFIRCDQFLPSPANFLNQLSKTIGAGIKNPEDLTPLRPSLSSKKMILVIDNVESILDPQGADGKEIYRIVEELSRFPNIYLIITSRISAVPPDCETLKIPTLSMEAACDTFYRICKYGVRSDSVSSILRQLDFHPLSVTLLATVAHENEWDDDQLVKEWDQRRAGVLHTEHDSLAATIELSLSSPMFKGLGPDARELLGIVAFFPQGVDKNNLNWLFPTIPDRNTVFDKFCTLSLAHRSRGFVTMLAPLRDHLCPQDPMDSPLLCATKEHYFTRLSLEVNPTVPGSRDGQWITSEDTNVEHLLNVFTSIDANAKDVWDSCAGFLDHLFWYKPRQTVLRSRIEQLPDDHEFKPVCLFELARSFESAGDDVERKLLLTRALGLYRGRGKDAEAAVTLQRLSDANRKLDLYEEGIEQVKEALEIQERLGNEGEQANCLISLAFLLHDNEQLDAAEEAVSRTINLLSEKNREHQLCSSHRLLGSIHRSKGEREKAIHHYKTALGIASRFNWNDQPFWILCSLARLFCDEEKFDDAHAYAEQAKLRAVNSAYYLGCAAEIHATTWYRQCVFEDAISEALRAVEMFEKLGAAKDLARSKALLRNIEQAALVGGHATS